MVKDLPDVQNTEGDFKFQLMAGVKGVRLPIKVHTREGLPTTTVASIDAWSRLPRNLRGINMSRLPIIINDLSDDKWVVDQIQAALRSMLKSMNTELCKIRVEFPYFFDRQSPLSHLKGKAYATVTIGGYAYDTVDGPVFENLILQVETQVMTLCPCSKEISELSAHNQRAFVTITVSCYNHIWIEELVDCAEQSASAVPYPILKRPDEKHITEFSYAHPTFVEDVARKAASLLVLDERIQSFYVRVRSEESIHQHDAVAEIDGGIGGAI